MAIADIMVESNDPDEVDIVGGIIEAEDVVVEVGDDEDETWLEAPAARAAWAWSAANALVGWVLPKGDVRWGYKA